MPVYFLDKSEHVGKPLNLADGHSRPSKDILLDLDSNRCERQHLARNLVRCDRLLGQLSTRELRDFKAQQQLQVMRSVNYFEQIDKSRSLFWPRSAQASNIATMNLWSGLMVGERLEAADLSSCTNDNYENTLGAMRVKFKRAISASEHLKKIKSLLELSLEKPKSRMTRASTIGSRKYSFPERLDSIKKLIDLSTFLDQECSLDLLRKCQDSQVTSISKLCSLQPKDFSHLPLIEIDSARLMSTISSAKTDSLHGSGKDLLKEYPLLFQHRAVAQNCISNVYEQLRVEISENNVSSFQKMLSEISRDVINFQDQNGWTLVHRAVMNCCVNPRDTDARNYAQEVKNVGSIDFLDLLIRFGADVNKKNIYGRTPLHYAAMEGSVPTCLALLNAGAVAAVTDKYGMTPIQHALLMRRGMWIEVQSLLSGPMQQKEAPQHRKAHQKEKKASRVKLK